MELDHLSRVGLGQTPLEDNAIVRPLFETRSGKVARENVIPRVAAIVVLIRPGRAEFGTIIFRRSAPLGFTDAEGFEFIHLR